MSHPIVRDAIAALPAYNSGESPEALQRALGLDRIIKLDSNENTLGASAAAIAAARQAVANMHRYPDRDETELRAALGDKLGIDPCRCIFSGGSEDVLSIVYRMVLEPGDEVVTLTPGFGLHAICAQACGADVTLLGHKPDWGFPVEEMCTALARAPKILAFASPSNPVGSMLSREEIERLLAAQLPDTLLVFDEAYIEFAGPEWATWLLERLSGHACPWVVLRTFAKAYALAGMRVGYGLVWDQTFAVDFHKTRSPFNVNAVALAAAAAAVRDEATTARNVATLVRNRTHLGASLRAADFRYAPSHGNFLFIDSGSDGVRFASALRQRGVLVKPWLEPGYTQCFRATVGTEEECDLLVTAMIAVRAALDTTVTC